MRAMMSGTTSSWPRLALWTRPLLQVTHSEVEGAACIVRTGMGACLWEMLLRMRAVIVWLAVCTRGLLAPSEMPVADAMGSVHTAASNHLLLRQMPSLSSPHAAASAAAPGRSDLKVSVLQKDGFLVFRALCKLSIRTSDSATVADPTAIRGKVSHMYVSMRVCWCQWRRCDEHSATVRARLKNTVNLGHPCLQVLALELLKIVLDGCGPTFRASERFLSAIRQYLCLSLLKNSASSVPQALQLCCAIFSSLMTKFRWVVASWAAAGQQNCRQYQGGASGLHGISRAAGQQQGSEVAAGTAGSSRSCLEYMVLLQGCSWAPRCCQCHVATPCTGYESSASASCGACSGCGGSAAPPQALAARRGLPMHERTRKAADAMLTQDMYHVPCRHALKAEVGVFFPMIMLKPIEPAAGSGAAAAAAAAAPVTPANTAAHRLVSARQDGAQQGYAGRHAVTALSPDAMLQASTLLQPLHWWTLLPACMGAPMARHTSTQEQHYLPRTSLPDILPDSPALPCTLSAGGPASPVRAVSGRPAACGSVHQLRLRPGQQQPV